MPQAFQIVYHPDVPARDLPRISSDQKEKIRKAIERKLPFSPQEFGEPLRRTLKGYWKLRVGDWRVIYKMEGRTVVILRIGHRREVYER
jgi:mRNA interferase RelE/StbE